MFAARGVLELLVFFEQSHVGLFQPRIGRCRWLRRFRCEDWTMAQDRSGRCPFSLLYGCQLLMPDPHFGLLLHDLKQTRGGGLVELTFRLRAIDAETLFRHQPLKGLAATELVGASA